MDSVHLFRYISIALVLALTGSGWQNQNTDSLEHNGQVIEWRSSLTEPERGAVMDIKVWPESSPNKDDNNECKAYGRVSLDATKSDKSGKFVFQVESKYRTYTVTYCGNGYYARADTNLPNNNKYLTLKPVEVVRRGEKPEAQPRDYEIFVRRTTLSALNDLAYLRSIRPEVFDQIITSLASEARDEQILNLSKVVAAWGHQQR